MHEGAPRGALAVEDPPARPAPGEDVAVIARGRVNLIGEHTDYNGGLVLPVALPEGATAVVTRRDGGGIGATTTSGEAPPGWERYVRAVAAALGVDGFDVRVDSGVPIGAGLGSSAALTVAVARALGEAFGLGLYDRAVALAAHRAESVELGIGSGPMDQLAAALGREGEALLVDCRDLSTRPIVLPPGLELLVVDSGVRHANATGGYRERVAECRRAEELLGVASLREVHDASDVARALPSPLDRRVRHVVGENDRVRGAVEALEDGDLARLGEVLRIGHASLRELYEVSVPEVDAIAALAEEHGALGARLTGGGFGGAVVAVCERGEAAAIGRAVVADAGPPARVLLAAGWPSS